MIPDKACDPPADTPTKAPGPPADRGTTGKEKLDIIINFASFVPRDKSMSYSCGAVSSHNILF